MEERYALTFDLSSIGDGTRWIVDCYLDLYL